MHTEHVRCRKGCRLRTRSSSKRCNAAMAFRAVRDGLAVEFRLHRVPPPPQLNAKAVAEETTSLSAPRHRSRRAHKWFDFRAQRLRRSHSCLSLLTTFLSALGRHGASEAARLSTNDHIRVSTHVWVIWPRAAHHAKQPYYLSQGGKSALSQGGAKRKRT